MGSLRQTPGPVLFLGLKRDGFAGELVVEAAGRRVFQWRDGAPIGLVSSAPEESLTHVLHERGHVADDGVGKIGDLVKTRGCSELQAAVALKVAPKDLLLSLAEQLRRGVAACLAATDGEFSFTPNAEPADGPPLPFDFVHAVHDAIVAHWRPDQILVALDGRATAYPSPSPGVDAVRRLLPASDAVESLCGRLDGSQATFALLGGASPETCAAFWILHGLGALRYAETAAAAKKNETPGEPVGPQIELVVSEEAGEAAFGAAMRANDATEQVLDEKAVALREEVLALHERLDTIDHYELLGIDAAANAAQVKKAYLKAAKRIHPDKIVNLGLTDIKEAANAVFTKITQAQEELSDTESRSAYDASLAGHSQVDANLVAQAEGFYRKGMLMVRAGNFLGAVELLESAVSLWPEEADYQAGLAWALHRKNPPESERSLEHFEQAVALYQDDAQIWLHMSIVVRELGDAGRADELAARAKGLDPDVKA
jgi:tetratricopeptide (TPR) repeat protein